MGAAAIEFLLSGFTDNSNQPLAAGKVYAYSPGTTTLKNTYTDQGKTTPEENPIILDSNGRKQVFAEGGYKLVVKTATDTLLYTFDNLYFGTTNEPILGGTASGAANVYAVAPAPALGSYTDGLLILFQAHQTNTSTATLNVSGLGGKTLSSIPGQIVAGKTYLVRYSSGDDRFYLLNPDPAEVNTQAQITALNAAGVGEIWIREPVTLTGNLTVSIPLKIAKGGSITTGGYTLTINGPFEAGRYQVFNTTSTVSFGEAACNEVLVEWFGAVADDSTNNAAALSAALASLPTKGVLKFGMGTYKGYLNANKANVRIKGCGFGVTTFHASDTTNHVITAAADKITIEGIHFKGAAVATDGSTSLYGVFSASANAATNLKIEDCWFSHNNNGVKFDASCNYGHVHRCLFTDFVGNVSGTGYGVLSGYQTGLQVTENFFFGSGSNGRHAVYLSAGASYSQVKHNFVDSFYWQGINQNQPSATPVPSGNQIEGNICYNCVTGGNETSGAIGVYGNSIDCSIRGNLIYQSGSKGIALDVTGASSPNLLNTKVEGNVVDKIQTIGIDNLGGVRTIIASNTVFNCSEASTGASAAIRLASDGVTASDQILIIGNHVTSNNSKQRCALQLNATSPTPTKVKLYANQFDVGTIDLYDPIEANGIQYQIDGFVHYQQTYDLASLSAFNTASAAACTKDVFTCTGADVKDGVIAFLEGDQGGIMITGNVKSANTVELCFLNSTNATVNITSTTLHIYLRKRFP